MSTLDDVFAGLDHELPGAEDEQPVLKSFKGRLKTVEDINIYVLAGKAFITLVSEKTGNRFTFRVTKPEESKGNVAFFVNVLNGPDNYTNYKYLGLVRQDQAGLRYEHGKKAKIAEDAPSAKAFKYFWFHAIARKQMPPQLEVWHEGKCARCGRKLTVPDSVERGIGPDCAEIMGLI